MKILTAIILTLTFSFFLFAPPDHPLRLSIRELPVETDAEGQPVIRDGEVQYESWIRVLPREPYRHRALTEFGVFGKRYVIGTTDADYFYETRNVIVTINVALLVFFSCLLLPVTVFSVVKRFYSRTRDEGSRS